jgi:hypothetical protein
MQQVELVSKEDGFALMYANGDFLGQHVSPQGVACGESGAKQFPAAVSSRDLKKFLAHYDLQLLTPDSIKV